MVLGTGPTLVVAAVVRVPVGTGRLGRWPATLLLRTGRPGDRVEETPRGRSGLRRAGWWVTPTRGDPRDSATENRPPPPSRDGGGKGETVEQETTSTPGDRRGSANPTRSKTRQRTTAPARRTARPSARVGRWRPSATAVVDGWSPHRPRGRRTEPGLQAGPFAPGPLACQTQWRDRSRHGCGAPRRRGARKRVDHVLMGADGLRFALAARHGRAEPTIAAWSGGADARPGAAQRERAGARGLSRARPGSAGPLPGIRRTGSHP